MSTRGYIIIKVKEENKGKSLKFDKSLLNGVRLQDENKWNGNGFDELTDNIWKPTKKVTGNYLAIYNQADSYPTGTGRALLAHFNNYEQALNLVAGGTTESVFGGHITYCKGRRKSLDEDPHYEDGSVPCQLHLPTACESWQYLFYEGRWYVRQWGSRWYDLEEYLTAKGDKADRDLPDMKQYKEIPAWTQDEQAHEVALAKFEMVWNTMLPEGRGLVHLRKAATL